jgi:hypothetical protein
VVWNSITSAAANKLERIQKNFMALCFKRYFPQVNYCHGLALEKLKLHTLQKRRHHLDALFLTQVCRGYTDCPSALEIVGLRVQVRINTTGTDKKLTVISNPIPFDSLGSP